MSFPAAQVGRGRPRLTERYRDFLPLTDATPALTLGEGFTPLVRLGRIGQDLGLANLYAKVEGQNPTGSFKDRGMVVAVSKALEAGARALICASTGNTSASAAAYGAAAGLEVVVVLPRGQIAAGKLLQAQVTGARVVAVEGNFDLALRIVRELAESASHPITLVNSVNPFRLEGQKTAAFEVCDDLGRAPEILAIPVGNAGNISAYWAGFRDYQAAGLSAGAPPDVRLSGRRCRPDCPRPPGRGARDDRQRDPDRRPGELDEGDRRPRRIGRPDRGGHRRRDPGGLAGPRPARGHLLRAFLGGEPGRDSPIGKRGPAGADATTVCVLTGSGLKDPTTAAASVGDLLVAEPTAAAVTAILGW